MVLASTIDFTLPLADPVLKFLLILLIILAAPLLLNKLRIPHLLGLIIAGAIIGPHGFNLVLRDSSIILSGTAGLLYIMFLAGLEIDMADFKRNSTKSLAFGMYTFLIPMILGTVVGIWILRFNVLTSVLLASMFASHTLIAYPIISKLGISKNKAVSITVGGTMITDTLALLVLTIIVGMATGQVNDMFWIRLGGSILIFALIVLFGFPFIGRWFFKHVHDNISQYIFVLVMVFLGSFLAQVAGMEAIIGAFLSGLALNRLIPQSSPLMNRVEFVGNAIFIPFFLLGVGMLIDYRTFFTSFETIKVGLIMIIVATAAKYIAAWMTQKTFHLSTDQRSVIFGLSNAQAAATLAAVMVGYNVITGTDANGEPIRLLNESVLNGTILMILVTCTIASFAAQKGAHNIAAQDISDKEENKKESEHILIPVSNEETVEELVNLSLAIKSPQNKNGLFALKVIDNHHSDEKALKQSRRVLQTAVNTAAATDTRMKDLLRYDLSVSNAIASVVKEREITDLVVGLHKEKDIPAAFLGHIVESVLAESSVSTFIYKPAQPISTVRRHLIIIPELAEKEIGFNQIIFRLRNVTQNTGTATVFYGSEATLNALKKLLAKKSGEASYIEFNDWDDFLIVFRDIKPDDTMWIILSRKEGLSYAPAMARIPKYLNKYFQANSFVLAYPVQAGMNEGTRYLT
ncbi:cation:proton antiporter [Parabacteroides distasonis]|uniref:cation:proton antiporter n=1 Tax=Parabacteroides distasonis TaxID=823 RepID=UPI0018A00FAC|nr:cation:proton antiporter [Parabacteroides distasonis]MDB9151434.1 cation:proton antiporter [Parabacteroides distasonis]MDB9156182.1 cation:proton antiporter [Parabacteroides distasonis]MDB9165336.1 cation:proton antiporter [Parabacteroides distasonis]MDB9169915.1 cation:proton antiporter [Parabacteroides distasonis]MDB9194315.1 cation:proton antiporter [Parabacteroides distasonis]